MSNKERITITIDPETLARVDRLAELRDISRSKLIETLLDLGVEEAESTMDKLASPMIGPIVQSVLDHPKLVSMLASVIGEKLSPEEIAQWEDMAPRVRAARGRLKDKRGRRNDLESGGSE